MALHLLHVDMDAFFAAIEVRDNPALRGLPVIVGAPPDRRGVVSTCSYEARVFGVHSAMPSRTAYKLCPQGVFLPGRHAHYSDVSRQVMEVLESFTPFVEPVSVDEAFLDVAGVLHAWPDAAALARALKARIRKQLGLTASVGVATNLFLAKLASDLHKPDGLTVAPEDDAAIRAWLAPLPVGRLWGIGQKSEPVLAAAGIKTIGDLQRLDEARLVTLLGIGLARHVWPLANGRDERRLSLNPRDERTISHEHTFDEDCRDQERVRGVLLEQAERVAVRLREAGRLARTARIKVRFGDFSTITRQAPFPAPTDTDRELRQAARLLWEREGIRRPVRLIGFGVSDLVAPADAAPRQPLLFPEFDRSAAPPTRARDQRIDRVVDRLRANFGRDAIRRGE